MMRAVFSASETASTGLSAIPARNSLEYSSIGTVHSANCDRDHVMSAADRRRFGAANVQATPPAHLSHGAGNPYLAGSAGSRTRCRESGAGLDFRLLLRPLPPQVSEKPPQL